MDKTLILKEIKKAYGFKSDADFARFLGISPQTLYSWYRRNVLDVDILYEKCKDINPDFILAGCGEVMRNGDKSQAIIGNNNHHNTNSQVDNRLLDMLEKNQIERLELLSIIKNLTSK